ncbi:MAG: hypothetical protein M1819_002948 [Sarea resinae]|nr:MAG: hypothetical protein M1819_002948 [Sarea resinae]
MDVKPIPAFYCCYLLRSTVRHSSLYIGSTPNPVRRLNQHNGLAKGGAVRTSKSTLRPWEMTCIVTGFPSNVAALQFEWAWQNSHLTRHISTEERITTPRKTVRISPKTGRSRKRPARPRTSLTDHLGNLHLLLRAHTFSRWPLAVRFFSQDVFRVWERWSERVDGQIREGIAISLELGQEPQNGQNFQEAPPSSQSIGKQDEATVEQQVLRSLDVGYGGLKPHLEKSLSLLAEGEGVNCKVCSNRIESKGGLALVCTQDHCRTASHLTCLASRFLEEEEVKGAVVPTEGHCPGCQTKLRWADLVKELALRTRGEKEVAKIMKKPRERRTKTGAKKKASVTQHTDSGDEDALDISLSELTEDQFLRAAKYAEGVTEDDDDWVYRENDDDDAISVTSAASEMSPVTTPSKRRRGPQPASHIVIEDSDCDEVD